MVKILIELKQINIDNNKLEIEYHINTIRGGGIAVAKISGKPINIRYNFDIPKNYFLYCQIFLGTFLPYLASIYDDFLIRLPISENKTLEQYWNNYLKFMFKNKKINLDFEYKNEYCEDEQMFVGKNDTQIGLFYGGGVESTFALSTLYHKHPVLISINGENWMNADKSKSQIKYNLINDLISSYKLNFQEVYMNIRNLIDIPDIVFNRYITGNLFYFLSLPIANKYNLNTLLLSTELEYALAPDTHDTTIHPRFVDNLNIKLPNYPVMSCIYCGYSKIEMFKKLSETDFIKYIYSCFQNSDKRWCGKCSKCFRISEYCDRIGLNRNIIGMQENICGYRENSDLSIHYWKQMDKIYGRKYLREIYLAVKKFLSKE